MSRTRLVIKLAASVLVAATLPAQPARDDEQLVSRTFDVGSNGELSISNVSGDIVIEGTSGNVISLEALKRLHGRADSDLLDDVEIEIFQTGDRVRVETRYPRGGRRGRHGDHNGGVSVSYRVTVPVGTTVEAGSVSGDVRITGVEGETSANSVSGNVDISDAANLVSAKSVSGNVDVRRARAEHDLEIASVSGEVTVSDIESRELDVSSVSGDVRMDDVTCEQGEFDSVSGDIHYTGRIRRGGRYEFKSHSGDVVVTIGDDVGFELEAGTFSGDVESDFTMQVTSRGDRGRSLSALVGDGSAVIEATTFSGDVELRRR